jgi:hypothetical protein
MAGSWRRVAWMVAFFALAGTPVVRAACAAACDPSAAHGAPAAQPPQEHGHQHAHHHPAAPADAPTAADPPSAAQVATAGSPACDEFTAVPVAGPRAGLAGAPPASIAVAAPGPRPVTRLLQALGTRARPPGAIAPLPLRI